MFRSTCFAVAALATGMLAACGDDSASVDPAAPPEAEEEEASASNAVPDPCGLLTTDEVANAVGRPVGAGEPGEPLAYSGKACSWRAEPGEGLTIEITLEVLDRLPVELGAGEQVPGLGVDARWEDLGVLKVVTDDRFFQVWATYMHDDITDPRRDSGDDREAAIALGTLVLAHI